MTRFCVAHASLFLFIGSLIGPAPALSDDLPDVTTLLAAVARASGAKPVNEELTVTSHSMYADGATMSYTAGADSRIITFDGPFTEESGSSDGHRWKRNENGQVVIDDPDPGLATPDILTTTIARVHAPLEAYQLSVLTSSGTGVRNYYDPATYHLVRQEEIDPAKTIVSTFDDFRTKNGYTRPWHWTVNDGVPSETTDVHLVDAEYGTVTGADVAIPGSRRLVDFPTGIDRVELPVSFHDGKFIVRVTIAGRGLDFILDSGADGIAIDEDVVKSLGLKIVDSQRNSANARAFEQSRAIVPSMSVGALSMTNVEVGTIPSGTDAERPGVYKTVGLLGYDFIAGASLSLDYEGHKVTAFEPESFKPPDSYNIAVPIRLGSYRPMTDVTVNGSLGEDFLIDTGAAPIGLTIFGDFAARYPAVTRNGVSRQSFIRMRGVGGDLTYTEFAAARVKIANVTFTDVDGYLITGNSYGTSGDGLIGPTFLVFFTVYLDYNNEKMYLVPNSFARSRLRPGS